MIQTKEIVVSSHYVHIFIKVGDQCQFAMLVLVQACLSHPSLTEDHVTISAARKTNQAPHA